MNTPLLDDSGNPLEEGSMTRSKSPKLDQLTSSRTRSFHKEALKPNPGLSAGYGFTCFIMTLPVCCVGFMHVVY